jgi:hypothetical protein
MECLNRVAAAWKCSVFSTEATGSADIDAILTKGSTVYAVAEVKSREMGLDDLKRFGSYLITFDKLLKLRAVGRALCVPSLVIVSLLKDDRIVYWKLSDALGNFCVQITGKTTQTQATCNGGQIDRYNGYIALDEMRVL